MTDPTMGKLKEKKPGQRACDQKDAKGKLCVGHLKRWFTPSEAARKELGDDTEVYRCERCHTLYRPASGDRSSAGRNLEERVVNIFGWAVHKK